MRKLGIIQPGRLGDIIICLPIAKFYFDRGYEIIWPILNSYYSIFRDVTYVNFINLNCDILDSVYKSLEVFSEYDCEIIDLSFGFPGSSASKYHYNTDFATNFVEAKYKLANVPLSERWNLKYNRNHKKELELYNKIIKNKQYILVHEDSSQGNHICFNGNEFIKLKQIEDYTIFNWMKIIENASAIYCVDSSLCNLIESQRHLSHKPKKYFTVKPHSSGWGRTTLTNNWEIINSL